MTIRNQVFDALLALGDLRWGNDESFVERSRRLKMWDKAPSPALYQVEGTETVASLDGQLDKQSLGNEELRRRQRPATRSSMRSRRHFARACRARGKRWAASPIARSSTARSTRTMATSTGKPC